MIPKKTNRANLESWKSTFFMAGLVLALLGVYGAMEMTKEQRYSKIITGLENAQGDEKIIPITRQELKQAELPKPQQVIIDLNIVDDKFEVDDNFNFEAFDADPDDNIIIKNLIANAKQDESMEEEAPFLIVESMPTFQGGEIETFRDWVQSHLVYPSLAMENQVSGRVYVSFVVEKDGSIQRPSINILRGVDPSLDDEVIRVLLSAPKWEPGKQREKPVRVAFSIPVNFILQ